MPRKSSIIMSAAETKSALKNVKAQIKEAEKAHADFMKEQKAALKDLDKQKAVIDKAVAVAEKAHAKALAPLLKQQEQYAAE